MNAPTDKELNAAVAKLNGWRRLLAKGDDDFTISIWVDPNETKKTLDLPAFPAQDWNALMAAVAKLEYETNTSFTRQMTAVSLWHVRFNKQWFSEDFQRGSFTSEARALALCIHEVVNQ